MFASVNLTLHQVLERVKISYPEAVKLLTDKLVNTNILASQVAPECQITQRSSRGEVLWFHAASIGETAVILPVVNRCLQERPDISIVFTTCSPEAHCLLTAALPCQVAVLYAPLDSVPAIDAFLSYWRPKAAVLVEEELWPTMLQQCRRRGISLALLNASLSPNTFSKWHDRPAKRAQAESLLACFSLIVPQSDLDVARFRLLGATLAQMPGWCADLKYAASMGACVWQLWRAPADRVMALRQGVAGRPLWLAACVHEDEEESLANVHKALLAEWPSLLTVLAPRIPARSIDLALQLHKLGLHPRIWQATEQDTDSDSASGSFASTDVLILDNLADMPLLYAVSEIAFIGWSLEENGSGHNLAEAAISGCAVVVGAHAGHYNHMADELNHAAVAAAEEAQAAAAAEARLGGCQPPTPARAAAGHYDRTGRPMTAHGRRRSIQAATSTECATSPPAHRQNSPMSPDGDARPSTAPASYALQWAFEARGMEAAVDSPSARSEHLECADREGPLVSEDGSLRFHDRWPAASPNSPLSPSASVASDAVWPDSDPLPVSPWRPYQHISGAISDEGVYGGQACSHRRDGQASAATSSKPEAEPLDAWERAEMQEQGCTPTSCGPVSDNRPSRTPWQATTAHRRGHSRLRDASFDDRDGAAAEQATTSAMQTADDLSPPLRYQGEYIVPATHLPFAPHGPAVWRIEDVQQLTSAIASLLREPLERRSRGHAAQIAASRLAGSLVGTVWELLDAHVLQTVFSTSHAP
ncbi:hypothetical protein WJX72_009288 [[Myrmecia] bisecta]|uniref:3-deoxy-D-manno-octulosonic-acid transferase N-terminal domain-containing protein n=1 Tax=[Myrmecia] bisecta TaxID=41462 RepID=A0AAW1QS76_9CHLO